jgi:haloalkane dehalogenase
VSQMTDAGFVPAPAVYPFAPRWYETAFGRIHYIDEGVGQPILFVHGNPTWSFLYRHVIRGLRDGYRCIALDLLGFGLSDHPDPHDFGYTAAEHARVLRDFIEFLEVSDLAVMGHDWGGPISLWAAAEQRQQVSRLIMGNTWYWPVRDAGSIAFSRILSSAPLQWLIRERNLFVEQLLPAGTMHRPDADEMEHYRAVFPTPASRVGIAAFAREILAATPFLAQLQARVMEELRDIPLLLTWGMHDPLFAPTAAARFRQPFSDATFVPLPDAKHYIQEDAPGSIVAAITEWM